MNTKINCLKNFLLEHWQRKKNFNLRNCIFPLAFALFYCVILSTARRRMCFFWKTPHAKMRNDAENSMMLKIQRKILEFSIVTEWGFDIRVIRNVSVQVSN